MARPLIALVTDFGLRDHYVGTMKGVVLGICPDATLVDISHDIPPHDVLTGALELAAAYRYFPSGTIFLAVVDPGVGSPRRAIAAETGDYRFVAPDNGVLSAVFEDSPPKRVVELTDRRYARPTISRTFEGRDRFAPAAAWIAKGIALSALGRQAGDTVRLRIPEARWEEGGIVGDVLRVDRFGNLVTNIGRGLLERLPAHVDVEVGATRVSRIVATYADAEPGAPCALVGSSEHLEIAVSGGNAAEALGVGRGAIVRVRRGA
jgi:S-adenosylmethionine hydrolase